MVDWLKRSALSDYVEAQYTLGEMYEDGDEVERNRDLAVKYYRDAAGQGHHDAAGKLLEMGLQP